MFTLSAVQNNYLRLLWYTLNFNLVSTRTRRCIISRIRSSQATHWHFVYFISFQCYPVIYVKDSKRINSFQISRLNFLFTYRTQFLVSPFTIVIIYWSHKSCLQAHILLIYPSVEFHIFTMIDIFKSRYSPQTFFLRRNFFSPSAKKIWFHTHKMQVAELMFRL
jgi:hypothetical protein